MKTKLFSLLFAIVASIGTMQAAIVEGTCGENLRWSLDTKDSTLTISGSGEMSYSFDSVPWNDYKTYIAHVVFTDELTNIGNHAFSSCLKLRNVVLPEKIVTIGSSAFWGCDNLESINIPDSVRLIDNFAFSLCYSLMSLSVPDSVKRIGEMAFYGCTNLLSVSLGNGLTKIDSEAFGYCQSLRIITIGKAIEEISAGTFEKCSNIASLTVYAVNPPKGVGCGINPDSCVLYVPQENMETYETAVWWEDFKDIRPIKEQMDYKPVDLSFAQLEDGKDIYGYFKWDAEDAAPLYGIVLMQGKTILLSTMRAGYDKLVNFGQLADGKYEFQWGVCALDASFQLLSEWVYADAVLHVGDQAIENVSTLQSSQKVLRNGQIYIVRGNRTYTLTGQEVK